MTRDIPASALAFKALEQARRSFAEIPATYAGRRHLAESLTALTALVDRVAGLSGRRRHVAPAARKG